ncbi:MAG: RNA polymerase sigma factor [Parcubacteria group bacterium]|nr:RNA polymerase sigma factor [Parcubacteria group bacterium]
MSLFEPAIPETQAVSLTDEDILRCSQEDPRLFAILVDRYQESFLRTANRVLHNRDESEEVCQETFIKIYTNGKKFKKQPGIEPKSWMYKILMNTALIRYRKLKRRNGVMEYNDAIDYHAIPDKDNAYAPERYAIANEQRTLIEDAIAQMPKELGAVLRAHYLEDKSYQTISEEQKTSVGAIKMKLFRARKYFRDLASSAQPRI